MKSFLFLLLIIIAAWISAGWVTYTHHDQIKKMVDKIPPNTAEDIQKGVSAAYEAGEAIFRGDDNQQQQRQQW